MPGGTAPRGLEPPDAREPRGDGPAVRHEAGELLRAARSGIIDHPADRLRRLEAELDRTRATARHVKEDLVEKAESLKDSDDWNDTACG